MLSPWQQKPGIVTKVSHVLLAMKHSLGGFDVNTACTLSILKTAMHVLEDKMVG